MSSRISITLLLVAAPLVLEALHSARHERRLRRQGAVEAPGDPYPLMAVAYPTCFGVMILEGVWARQPMDRVFAAGLIVWALSKALKYAAIHALGERWSFRVLVLPGAPLIDRGPYRVMRHPNYLAVSGEILATALLCPAPLTGPIALAGFIALLVWRIRVEERALGFRR
jgi:methyltransferase